MRKNPSRGLSSVALALVAAFPCAALAGSTQYSYVSSAYTNGGTYQAGSYDDMVSIQSFNTSLGTLNDVQYSITSHGYDTGSLYNSATGTANFTVTETTAFNLSGNSVLASLNGGYDDVDSQTFRNLAAGGTATFGPNYPFFNASGTATLASDLATFETGGPILLNISGTATTQVVGGGGRGMASINPSSYEYVYVQYDYTPVPEPSSAAVFGAGLLAVGFLGARRRRPG